jgi:SAM-dependent methyltransferase
MGDALNAYDQALHDQIHTQMLAMDPKYLLRHHRLKILNLISDFEIKGRIADVGCGSGYFGIGVAKRYDTVEKVDCIEASKIAVESVIPKNVAYHGVNSKVDVLEGSFDALPVETYDVIFAMGALHHSRNLNVTIHSISKSLKPGGLLIAQEPAMPDATKHIEYHKKYNIVEERYGLKIKNGDRYDRFFRECEYKFYLINNGFDICLWQNFDDLVQPTSKFLNLIRHVKRYGIYNTASKVISKIKQRLEPLSTHSNSSWESQMSMVTKNVKNKLFVAKKSDSLTLYHQD